MAGMAVRVACPPGYRPGDGDVDRVVGLGGTLEVLDWPIDAAKGAQAVHTDVWASMGQEDEASARRASFAGFTVDQALLDRAAPDAVFLHCLPAHRGEEVTADVIDGPRSLVWDQAGNRLCTAQAVLAALVDGRLEGAAAG